MGFCNIAKNHFPLGAGFATFGSEMARKNFSPLYTMYGYKTDKFLNDTFWPIIIAQNGWIGLLAFFEILFFMMKYLIRYGRKMPSLFCSCLSIIAYLMICSAGESAFFHPVSCPMFIVFSLNVINMNHQKQIKNIVV